MLGKELDMGQLTVARITTFREPGRYVDGDGLMLLVKASSAQSWMLRVRMKGDRRGSYYHPALFQHQCGHFVPRN